MKTRKPVVLIASNGRLESGWPFSRQRFEERLGNRCELIFRDTREASLDDLDWKTIRAAAMLQCNLDEKILDRAAALKVVGGITDNLGLPCYESLLKRGIPFVDVTRAWAPSVAECGFALLFCALRRIAHWHRQLADGRCEWKSAHEEFTSELSFVSGDLGTKVVGVVGLGQIGGRFAKWSHAFGARVIGYDPFVSAKRFKELHATRVSLDQLARECDICMIATPSTPTAEKMIHAGHVKALKRGALVVTVTRTAPIDMPVLRRRVLANELFWATDVYDHEPLPKDDPILGRENVVHVPHIAGRTKDTNLRLADLLADDFLRIFRGKKPLCELTPAMVTLRCGKKFGPQAKR